nr:PAS domain-containing protein [Thiorhodovibrio winogradskyi]
MHNNIRSEPLPTPPPGDTPDNTPDGELETLIAALRDSEERLALAIDAASAGLWTLDVTTNSFWASPQTRALFGYTPEESIPMARFRDSVLAEDWPAVEAAIARALGSGDTVDVEYRIPGPDGVRWIAARGAPVSSASAATPGLMGIVLDISERQRLAEALRANEARLAAGADLAGLAFYELGFDDDSLFADARCRELLGLPPNADGPASLRHWLAGLHPEDRDRVLEQRAQLHQGQRRRLAIEYRYCHPSRGELWLDHLGIVAERDASDAPRRSFGVLRDIGHKKRIELELRRMSQQLLRAQERERALVARELHDDLSQRLAALAIELARAEQASAATPLAATLGAVRAQLAALSEDVHNLAYQLHPSVLDELGLAEALRAECERRGRHHRLAIHFAADPLPAIIGKEAALCLFRIAQEALSNLIRHAGAERAELRLCPQDGGLLLAVQDNGSGFDPQQPERGRHLGLASMRDRIHIAGGTLDIDSAPGRGTTVLAWVPGDTQ